MSWWVWLIILGAIVLIAVLLVGMYNKLVRLRNRAENAWAQVDVQLRKRYDLIPNLVEAVKGYAAHERQVFEEVTEARTRAQQAQGVQEQAQAENALTAAIGRLFAVAEAYPELKANENFLSLQQTLAGTEDAISGSRRAYNEVVRDLNTRIETVPSSFIASMFNFQRRDFFEIQDAAERAVPQVRF